MKVMTNRLKTEVQSTQVDSQNQTEFDSGTLLEFLYQFNDEDKVYIISKCWSSIDDEQNKLVIVYDLINKMGNEMQCDLYTLLGNSFNKILYKYTYNIHEYIYTFKNKIRHHKYQPLSVYHYVYPAWSS